MLGGRIESLLTVILYHLAVCSVPTMTGRRFSNIRCRTNPCVSRNFGPSEGGSKKSSYTKASSTGQTHVDASKIKYPGAHYYQLNASDKSIETTLDEWKTKGGTSQIIRATETATRKYIEQTDVD